MEKILKQGFNRSYAGRHGALLGHASYFSTDPKYSLRFCDRKGGGSDRTKAALGVVFHQNREKNIKFACVST